MCCLNSVNTTWLLLIFYELLTLIFIYINLIKFILMEKNSIVMIITVVVMSEVIDNGKYDDDVEGILSYLNK